MRWWEKTVEYFFIRKHIPEEIILSPLDGKHELAGDAFLSSNQKWVILEFKKDMVSLDAEKKKYKDYTAASAALSNHDSHHFLIFGQIQNGKFDLGWKTYFSRMAVAGVEQILSSGKPKEQFIAYLKKLIEYKSAEIKSAGGAVGSYSFVAGINKENKITSCMNLYEFGLDHGLKLEPQLDMTKRMSRGRGGPSMSM